MRNTFDTTTQAEKQLKSWVKRILWVVVTAALWPPMTIAANSASAPLDPVFNAIPAGPFVGGLAGGEPWPDWSIVAFYAFGGLFAFLLIFLLRRFARAPRYIWFGVLIVEAPSVIMFFLAIAGSAVGYHPAWLVRHLISFGDAGPDPLFAQLIQFVAWWIWGAFFAVLGAWAGSLVPTPTDRITPCVEQAHRADAVS